MYYKGMCKLLGEPSRFGFLNGLRIKLGLFIFPKGVRDLTKLLLEETTREIENKITKNPDCNITITLSVEDSNDVLPRD